MQKEIHGAEAGDAVHEFDAEEGAVLEPLLLGFVEAGSARNEIVSGEEKESPPVPHAVTYGVPHFRDTPTRG
jgi:hypothetical protein